MLGICCVWYLCYGYFVFCFSSENSCFMLFSKLFKLGPISASTAAGQNISGGDTVRHRPRHRHMDSMVRRLFRVLFLLGLGQRPTSASSQFFARRLCVHRARCVVNVVVSRSLCSLCSSIIFVGRCYAQQSCLFTICIFHTRCFVYVMASQF